MQNQSIVWFSQVDKDDVDLVGGKGANLGELTKINAPIPEGFIITSEAYFQNLKKSGAIDRIRGILYDLDVEDPIQLERKAKACHEEIKNISIHPFSKVPFPLKFVTMILICPSGKNWANCDVLLCKIRVSFGFPK